MKEAWHLRRRRNSYATRLKSFGPPENDGPKGGTSTEWKEPHSSSTILWTIRVLIENLNGKLSLLHRHCRARDIAGGINELCTFRASPGGYGIKMLFDSSF